MHRWKKDGSYQSLDGKGFVRVVKVSPEIHPEGYTPEYLIAKAASSYGSDNKLPPKIKYLSNISLDTNIHLLKCNITFHMRLPIPICRQLLRHRTGKFNELSQRYTEVDEDMSRLRMPDFSESFGSM